MSETINPESLMEPGPRWWEWLFTPFHYVAGGTALVIGVVAVLVAGWVGWLSGSVFDGVLGMHFQHLSLRTSLLACGVDWLSLALVLLVVGKLMSRTSFRALDLFGTQAFARWPLLLAAVAALLPRFEQTTNAILPMLRGAEVQLTAGDLVGLAVVMLVTIVAFVWTVALMYQSYRVCCNVRGVAAVVSFVAGLLIAQVVSAVALQAMGVPMVPANLRRPAAVSAAPSAGQVTAPASAALTQQADRLVDLLAKGDYHAASQGFDPTMRAALPADKLKAAWEGLVAQSGPFQARVADRTAQEGGFEVVYVTCQFQRQRMAVKVVFDQSRQVSGLWFVPPP